MKKKIGCIAALVCFVLVNNISAQLRPVNIGDAVPDTKLDAINYTKSKIKLSEFKGKILILDFWATWCGPCVASFPKLDSLQKKFNDRIQILPVTYQAGEIAARFLANVKKTKGLLIPSVVNDKQLDKYFPHTGIPHVVWIDKKGNVLGISGSDAVNAANIEKALTGEPLEGAVKFDYKTINQDLPFFSVANTYTINSTPQLDVVADSQAIFRSVLTKYRPTYPLYSAGVPNRYSAINLSIETLYACAFGNSSDSTNNTFLNFLSAGRVKWELRDTGLLNMSNDRQFSLVDNRLEVEEWNKKFAYCYEIVTPSSWDYTRKFQIMQHDLNQYFKSAYGIRGRMERRTVRSLALTRTNEEEKFKASGGHGNREVSQYRFKILGERFSALTETLTAYFLQSLKLPILDKTGYSGKVDLELNCNLSNIEEINNELEKYGLKFEERDETVDIIIISDH